MNEAQPWSANVKLIILLYNFSKNMGIIALYNALLLRSELEFEFEFEFALVSLLDCKAKNSFSQSTTLRGRRSEQNQSINQNGYRNEYLLKHSAS